MCVRYTALQLDEAESSMTAAEVNKGIRGVLKQVAQKYGGN